MAQRLEPLATWLDGNGDPGSSYQLFVYKNRTTTKITTYKDPALTTPHTNPIILNSSGRPAGDFPIYFTGAVTMVYANSTDSDPPTSELYTVNDYSGSGALADNLYYYVSSYADLAAAVTAVNALNIVLTLVGDDATLMDMDENVTTDAEVTFQCIPGEPITTTGYTMTFGGPVLGAQGAFDGTGTVTFNGPAVGVKDMFSGVGTINMTDSFQAGQYGVWPAASTVSIYIKDRWKAGWFSLDPANTAADNDTAISTLLAAIPAIDSDVIDANNEPGGSYDGIAGAWIDVGPGVYKVSTTISIQDTKGVVFNGTGGNPLVSYGGGGYGGGGTYFTWHGAAGGTVFLFDDAPSSGLRNIGILGRGVAGEGIVLDHTTAGTSRGFGIWENVFIRDCTTVALEISTTDAVNLNQVDNLSFKNLTIWDCEDGIISRNRNNINIAFHNLKIIADNNYIGSITPNYAIKVLEGGMELYDFHGPDDNLTDYVFYIENGWVNVFGGYCEEGDLVEGSRDAPYTLIGNSSFYGFNQNQGSIDNYTIDWNVEELSLNFYGGRIGNVINEGANSGGVNFFGTKFHNVPVWTGRTKFSSVRNCRILRGVAGAGTEYILNWDGLSKTDSCDTDKDVWISNNLQRRDTEIETFSAGDSGGIRLEGTNLIHYQKASATNPGNYNLDYSDFTTGLTSGVNGSQSYIGMGANRITWTAAAPADGTWTQADVAWNTGAAAGGDPGWMCVTSGTFSAATDATGDTDGSTAIITGMTDTSDFEVGQFVTTSAGFPNSVDDGDVPVLILAITTTTMTIDDTSDSAEADITVLTPSPAFKAMANLDA